MSTVTSFSAINCNSRSLIYSLAQINLFELNQVGQQPQNIVLRLYFLIFPNKCRVERKVEHAKISANVLSQCTPARMTILTCYNNLRASLENGTAVTGSTNS